MAAKKRVSQYGFAGYGQTMTEAKADLQQQIGKALSDTYTPWMMTKNGWTVLVYRTPYIGWVYSLIHPGDNEPNCCTMDSKGKEDAISSARFHLAQTCQNYDTGYDSTDLMDPSDVGKINALKDYFQWQCCYRAWRKAGLTDDEAIRQHCNRYPPEFPPQ